MPNDMEAVLAANATFYRCFAARDMKAMGALWSERSPVACVHPGWKPLVGRMAVLASWRSILLGSGAPSIRHSEATAHVAGDVAFVTCIEELPGGELAATNVFVREPSGWRLVHHHAGPIASAALSDEDDEEEDEDDEPPSGLLN